MVHSKLLECVAQNEEQKAMAAHRKSNLTSCRPKWHFAIAEAFIWPMNERLYSIAAEGLIEMNEKAMTDANHRKGETVC